MHRANDIYIRIQTKGTNLFDNPMEMSDCHAHFWVQTFVGINVGSDCMFYLLICHKCSLPP